MDLFSWRHQIFHEDQNGQRNGLSSEPNLKNNKCRYQNKNTIAMKTEKIYISSDCLKSFLTCGLYRYAKKVKMQKAGKPEKETFSGN